MTKNKRWYVVEWKWKGERHVHRQTLSQGDMERATSDPDIVVLSIEEEK